MVQFCLACSVCFEFQVTANYKTLEILYRNPDFYLKPLEDLATLTQGLHAKSWGDW